MYADETHLIYQKGSQPVHLTSWGEVHQGYPMGTALFSLTSHSILFDTKQQHPDVQVLAYLDDFFVVQVGTLDASQRLFKTERVSA